MAIYSFNTVLLSAQKTGTPNLIGTSLSASGVGTVSLSTNDVGISFTSITPLVSSSVAINVKGSVFNIDNAYNNSTMALIHPQGGYTTFTVQSAYSTAPLSAFTSGHYISTPDTRRKRNLGY